VPGEPAPSASGDPSTKAAHPIDTGQSEDPGPFCPPGSAKSPEAESVCVPTSDDSLAAFHESIGLFDQAAADYQRCLQHSSGPGEQEGRALRRGVTLLLALDEPERAIALLESYGPRVAERTPWLTAELDVAVAQWYSEQRQYDGLITFLSRKKKLARIDGASIDLRIRAHAALGRAKVARGKPKAAEAEYEKVLSFWADPRRGVREILGAEPSEASDSPATQIRLAETLSALGEALYSLAEIERQRTVRATVLRYSGPRTPEGIKESWKPLKQDIDRIRRVTEAYKRVVDLQPVPAPRWVIAAASRVGDLWSNLSDRARAAGAIGAMRRRDLAAAFRKGLEQATAPWVETAKQAFHTCVAYSAKYQWSDELSRRCEDWLARHFPEEFEPTADFVYLPTWRAAAPIQVWPAVDRRGQPLRPWSTGP
jgi:tetratricopeptide (TPR) repeat protein